LIAGGDIEQAEIYQSAGSPIEPPDSLQITPASANVVVGGTQQFTAIDNFGYPRQDVTWTVSNPSLATVTTDENDAAVLTGLAAGQVTLTANAETASAQEQVTILAAGSYPPGTVIWSAPPVPGFSAQQLVQAVPTGTGPDLYSTQLSSDSTQSVVQALTADGRQLWQAALPKLNNNSVPDGIGGLLVTEYDTCTSGQTMPLTVVDLDPVYGQPLWSVSATGIQVGNQIVYCYGNGYDAPQIAVRGDGAVIISGPTNNGFPPLSVMNTPTCCGYYRPIPTSTNTINGNTIYVQCCMGPPMVNSDGWGYVEYEVRNVVNNVITSDNLYLQGIAPTDNSFPTVLLSATTQNQALLPGPIVPDGQGGILATWTISPSSGPVPQYPYQAVDVVAGVVGTPYNLPFSPTTVKFGQSPTIVLGEGGTGFATNGTDTVNGPAVASFNVASGSVNWTYQAGAQYTLSIIAATAGNGLVAKTTDQSGNDTVLTFNSSGVQGLARRNPSPSGLQQLSGASSIDYYANGWYLGFKGNSSVALSGDVIQFAVAPGTRPHGDAQHNGTTDPGFKVVGVRDCYNKYVVSGTSYERLPIYELWDVNGNKPVQHYTVFEHVLDNLGNITSLTQCADGSNTGTTPCEYADGTNILFNTFQDDIAIGNRSETTVQQYFKYGVPGQRLWDAQIYRTLPDGSGTSQFIPHVSLSLHLIQQAQPLILEQPAPYMGPWYNANPSYPSCNQSGPN
jgi:hypothetical protein